MKEGEFVSDYNTVAYPSGVYTQTHPDRLATVARLFGLEAPAITQARVLELGCGDGLNLINLGHILPQAKFVGVDMAEKPIAHGQALIERSGQQNIQLHAADILKLDDSLGEFDYIIAHGLYSWVPPEVRDGIMRLCERSLSPTGVAYISYNAYPGNHSRDLARGIMRFHNSQFDDSETKIVQSRSILKFIIDAKPEPDLYRLALDRELKRVTDYNDSAFYHDDLSKQNQPFYFYQFIEHAEKHGMQYLGEADFGDMREDGYLPKTAAMLRQLGGNIVAREQYLDLLKNRAFRQTLLCRKEVLLDRSIPPTRVQSLYASANVDPPDDATQGFTCFSGPSGEIETGLPLGKFVLNFLGSRWPEAFAFEELVDAGTQHFRKTEEKMASDDRTLLATLLLRGYEAGPVSLHSAPPPCTSIIEDRPKASSLARFMISMTPTVPSLRHQTIRLEDQLGSHLIGLLDGKNDFDHILNNLSTFVKQTSAEVDLSKLESQLRENLRSLARTAILEKSPTA
jgi:methyltransferase-like protein/SAM-dependent methyltransferase